MPVPWFVLPTLPLALHVTQIDEDFTVVSKTVRFDRVNQVYRFTGGVEARTGPTSVSADELEVYVPETSRRAVARGNVKLVDPDGTLSARNLEMLWTSPDAVVEEGQERRFVFTEGSAEDIQMDVGGVLVTAAKADMKPRNWVLEDVYGTTCRTDPPLFSLRAPRIQVTPGKSGKVERPSVGLLGRQVVTLPSQRFNLDPRTQGIRPPALTYRKEDGIGVSWSGGWLMDDHTAWSATYASFKQERPSYSFQIARSFLSEDQTARLIVPRSELSDWLSGSYFDNIEQPGPIQESRNLRQEKRSLSIGSYWFQGASGADDDATFTKPLDVAYEHGGDFGALGALGQLRLQTIRRELGPVHTRARLGLTVQAEPLRLAPGLTGFVRADSATYAGAAQSGWVRGLVGAAYQPVRPVTLSASIHQSLEFGSPLFEIDELESPNGASARVDLNLGPTQVSYLWRYDRSMGWYDRQYTVSQVVGCLEPYILYRQFDNDYRFGVRFRLGNLTDILTRRRLDRDALHKTELDGPGRAR